MKNISFYKRSKLNSVLSACRFLHIAFCISMLIVGAPFLAQAQFQSEFGQNLLEKREETAEAERAELTIDYHQSNTFNNHIELGLSVDPYTSSLAGQESPQLEGLIQRAGVNLRGELPIAKRLRLTLQYAPQIENYTGAQGKLDEFDAFTDTFLTEFSFLPAEGLPPIVASHQFQRLARTSPVYNNTQRQLGIRFGRVLEYQLRIHQFDDESSLREDFLLIGSTMHKSTARLQFSLPRQILVKTEYGLEAAHYQTNLNNLILGVTGLADDERRRDWRHYGSAKVIQVAAERLVFQEEFNLFLNRSNVNFFNFASAEAALSAFYRVDTARWFRLRFSRLWLRFENRQIRDETGLSPENAPNRSDTQFGVMAQANWQFRSYLTLNAEYQFTQNRTNEEDRLLDFLNYQHHVVSVTFRGNY